MAYISICSISCGGCLAFTLAWRIVTTAAIIGLRALPITAINAAGMVAARLRVGPGREAARDIASSSTSPSLPGWTCHHPCACCVQASFPPLPGRQPTQQQQKQQQQHTTKN
mmetsp:Transcript_23979/g.41798  ORF Transcript_23979/g.41798 Transcript_23979/m.41798 type:complete len:112 (-) Transcript_23979:1590-1925(-)